MENQKHTTILEEALCYLSYAEAELNRPKEDVVHYCACHFSRKSATDFLKAFLAERKKNVDNDETLGELFARCVKLEPKFNSIDISCFACVGKCDKTNDEKYCLSLDHVTRCFVKADEIKDVVVGRVKLSEKSHTL